MRGSFRGTTTHPGRRRRSSGPLAVLLLLVGMVSGVGFAGGAGAAQGDLAGARAEAAAAAEAFEAAELRLEDTELAITQAEAAIELTRARTLQLRALVTEEALNEYIRVGSGQASLVAGDPTSNALASALSRAARGETLSSTDDLAVVRATLDRQLDELQRSLAEADRQRNELAARRQALFEHLEELERIDAARQESERVADQARRVAEAAAALSAYEDALRAQTQGGGSPQAPGGSSSPAPPRPTVPVNWLCPITGGYTFSDTWGAARSGGRSHKGTDVWADYGTPVVAVVNGEAVDYGWDWAGGNGVFLLGDDGNRYYYAHLDGFGTLGRVSQGQVVGYVGDTGNASGTPHLHFEIHPGGSGWTNPYPTLSQYC